MTDQEENILDSGKSLSQSRLWELQYAIYNYYGPEAWTRAGVPFYMTSNPYTARQYAAMVLGYIRDCIHGVQGKTLNFDHPFYIFDLGAGTGRFGYLFLRELNKSLSLISPKQIKVRYIMTDMIETNLEYLRHHPYLQEMINDGIIDFVYYHTSFTDQSLKLLVSGEELIPDKIVNPLAIIGNYFFDVIPQDLFKVMEQKLYEGQLTIASSESIDVANPHPTQLKNLKTTYQYIPVVGKGPYYEDPTQEAILRYYAKTYENIPFTVPVAAFQTLRYFKRLSQGHMLLLAGDQGVCNDQQIREAGEPIVSIQGGISLSVSYHALARYANLQGGAAWLTTYPDPLFLVIAAAFGGENAVHPETTLAFDNSFDYFQPSDYWKLTCCTDQEWKTPPIDYLLLLIKLGNWDPLNFHAFFPAIRQQLPSSSERTKNLLIETIKCVWQAFYPVTKEEGDFVINLGVLMFELHQFSDALEFFERAIDLGGENAVAYQNMAACYMALKRPHEALKCHLRAKDF